MKNTLAAKKVNIYKIQIKDLIELSDTVFKLPIEFQSASIEVECTLHYYQGLIFIIKKIIYRCIEDQFLSQLNKAAL